MLTEDLKKQAEDDREDLIASYKERIRELRITASQRNLTEMESEELVQAVESLRQLEK